MSLSPAAVSRLTHLRCFIAAATGTCIASSTSWMQPLIFQYLASDKHLHEATAGLMLTVEMGAMATGAMLAARFVPRVLAQRSAIIGLVLAAVGSLATIYADQIWLLFVSRLLVGLGFGSTVMISNIVAANFKDPDKALAQFGVMNLVFGGILVGLYPLVGHLIPAATPFTMIFGVILVLGPVLLILPPMASFDRAAEMSVPHAHETTRRAAKFNTLLLILVTAIVVLASGAVWGLYAVIGEQIGMAPAVVNAAISFAIFSSIVGVAAPALFGNRFGRSAPFTLAMVAIAGAIYVLTSHPSELMFRVAVCINISAIYFMMPYLSGAAIVLDGGGKAAGYVSSAFFYATALGPFVGGLALSTVGLGIIGEIMVVLTMLVIGIFIYVDRSTKIHLAQPLPAE
ncbi:arabinose efflux permease family protein [Caulobacter sp. AP07]|uniref:MFS transporter n=1 Tax=Caulobacter sp. AP07 TaxID=1144304 RepID=UPI000271E8D5|nr:MFS transporter [Caulobacter sp. AP07]EJL30784.1 arabinose efflux permease family protein [Caulobacter sp. AP07]